MQLTRFTDLSLRVLMYLARSDPQRTPGGDGAEIASQFEVPHNHLIKVVNKLGKLGWIARARVTVVCESVSQPAQPTSLRCASWKIRTDLVDCASINCIVWTANACYGTRWT